MKNKVNMTIYQAYRALFKLIFNAIFIPGLLIFFTGIGAGIILSVFYWATLDQLIKDKKIKQS